MNDIKFNHACMGYIVKAMEQSNFSRYDIDRMLRILDNNGFDVMTIEQAEQYMNDIWEGKVSLSHTDNREDRISTID